MLTTDQIDALTEQVVQAVLVGDGAGAAAFAMAHALHETHPQLPALMLALPFSMAGNAIETVLGGGVEAREQAQEAWRIAALIAADLAALSSVPQGASGTSVVVAGGLTIGDLARHWAAGDPVFKPAPDEDPTPREAAPDTPTDTRPGQQSMRGDTGRSSDEIV